LTPNQRESVETILKSAHRAKDLVRNLQSLSGSARAPAKTFDLHQVAVVLFAVLSETTNRLIRKEVDILPNTFFIHGSESDIYHSLMNLGVNAVQAIEEKGIRPGDQVLIRAEAYEATRENSQGIAPGPYVHVLFSDTGNGMIPEVRRRIFEPLFSTKQKGERKGQGLGLAMVYNIVTRQHAGLVRVESAPREGTTFHLFLPRSNQQTIAPAGPAPNRMGQGETILVVDDEATILALTRQALEGGGYQVVCASDGLEALEIFSREHQRIAVVLLDRTLPKLSGEAVFQRLKQLRPDARIILSSGEALNAGEDFPGAFGTLSKPYTVTALREVIYSATTAARATQSPVVTPNQTQD
jgi:CheY-like chemotaxis protein